MSAKTTTITTITTPVTKETASVREIPAPATTKTLTSVSPLPLSPPTTTTTIETTKTALSAPPPTTTMKSPASPTTTTRRQISNDNDIDCQGFSVREAMAILHPEEKNTEGSPCAASVLDALLDTTIRAEFTSACSHNPTPSGLQALSETELIKLEELGEANKGILAPLSEDYNFKEDQIALLKGGCTEMMLLHSVSAYDPDKDSWKIQQDRSRTKDIKLKVLKAATGNLYEEHKRFALAFDPDWKKDPHIIFLLCAITLFSPKRQHIIHTEAIRQEQGSYLYLTRRYLEVRYGTCLGRSTYHQLLHRLAHLHHLSEDHLRLFLEVNPTQVEPLLIEIFDLKQW
ncbi:thyroid hormone receptor alpha-like isoform X2 [Portunus trituberculatus]|uniref:thyroid hormone receptor alpha-like isoform X2 n=1 Tax=Portunus trituberculatus TaxID=210409 RepID=UPI001E1D143E|nr:thyroid hormone receptor alpha-like isoform X2 [Portunus trituberculatus]